MQFWTRPNVEKLNFWNAICSKLSNHLLKKKLNYRKKFQVQFKIMPLVWYGSLWKLKVILRPKRTKSNLLQYFSHSPHFWDMGSMYEVSIFKRLRRLVRNDNLWSQTATESMLKGQTKLKIVHFFDIHGSIRFFEKKLSKFSSKLAIFTIMKKNSDKTSGKVLIVLL